MRKENILQAALDYIERGYAPVPIPFKSKAPIIPEWQKLSITADKAPTYFKGEGNIGLLLGEPSTGLTDLDLDCREAVELAPYFLPQTNSRFGRRSAPGSHRLYIVNPAPKTTKWSEPADKTKSDAKLMLVELRSTGAQTVFPPSTHPSGELIRFEEDGKPAAVDIGVLMQAASRLAAASLLVRYFPSKGVRHDWALALAGALLRGGWTEDETTHFMRAVLIEAKSENPDLHLAAVRDTAKKLAAAADDPHVTGWPTLCEMLGERVVGAVRKWLGSMSDESVSPNGNGGEVVLVPMSEVTPEPVRWLWVSRIALGKVNLLIGQPGVGKSYLSLDMAARHSCGKPWPDEGLCPKGATILLGAEDGLADTIRPRLDALGADVTQIHAITAVREEKGTERGFDLSRDVRRLRLAVQQTKATLVVIDPLTAYLGKTESYKDAEVRAVLAPLARLADEEGVAVVCVMHLNKSTTATVLNRASGSVAFGATARTVFGIGLDPDDQTRHLFIPIKMNVAALPPALAFRIVPGGLTWEPGPVTGVSQERVFGAPARGETESQQEARAFLRDLMKDGTPVPAEDIYANGKKEGFSPKQLRRAAKAECVKIEKEGFQGKWIWTMPF